MDLGGVCYVVVGSGPFPRDNPIVPCQMADGDSFPPRLFDV